METREDKKMAKEEQLPCDVHRYKIANNEARLTKLEDIMDKVRNRLPVWATFVVAALLAIMGYLVAVISGGPK
uniref:Uncharacterized protein n=1 Tax=viral metagenome TaxID=1070528 RepID=A0A6M3LR79_9ZZZZ